MSKREKKLQEYIQELYPDFTEIPPDTRLTSEQIPNRLWNRIVASVPLQIRHDENGPFIMASSLIGLSQADFQRPVDSKYRGARVGHGSFFMLAHIIYSRAYPSGH